MTAMQWLVQGPPAKKCRGPFETERHFRATAHTLAGDRFDRREPQL